MSDTYAPAETVAASAAALGTTPAGLAEAVNNVNAAPAPADPFEQRLAAIEARMAGIEGLINQLAPVVGAAVPGVAPIVDRLGAVETAIGTLAGAVGTIEPAVRGMLGELFPKG